MLSIENPPPDPPCPSQLPQLKISSDESASHKLALPEVDLLKPSLDHTPLPKFSIRDYVFTARSKDIKTNWPFSQQNLQLCLKHGVKDLLPPFQPLDTIRNQSLTKCTVETSALDKKSNCNVDGEASGPIGHVALDSSLKPKLADTCTDISSCRSGGENDLPSATTSVSQSEIDSEPTNRPSDSPLETITSFEPSVEVEVEVEVEAAGPPAPHKTESTIRPSSGKKCRLIVKFGANSDRSSTEEITSNCTTVSETMASKICPVCKTFSSSSNTTLNAHIDQCLSVESTPKLMADSKLTRHRIKLRKTRLMVDIYTTAQPCTLEELDRRNGTSWATVSNLPTQDTEKSDTSAEGKMQRVPPVIPEDVGEVGAVYIDANGTKLRILSKSNDAPLVSRVGEDLGPSKHLKGDKNSKFLSTKKKGLPPKHHKYLKLASQSRKFFSHKVHASQVCGAQEGYSGAEESYKVEEHQMQKQMKSSDSGTLRQWVCSKRTGYAKKVNNQDGHQPLRCKWHASRDLLVESDQSCLGDSLVDRNHVRKYTSMPENQVSSPEVCERAEKPFPVARISDKRECSSGGKKVGSPLSGARISDNEQKSIPPMKRNANLLSKDCLSIHDSHMLKPMKSARNSVSSLSNQTVHIHAASVDCSGIPPIASTKQSVIPHALVGKALRLSSPGKNASSVIESRSNMLEKCSAVKKTQLHFMTETDEEVEAWVDQQYALMQNGNENQYGREDIIDTMSIGRGTVLEIRQDGGAVSTSQREEAMPLKSSQPASECYGHDEGGNTDSSVRADDDILDKVDGLESVGREVTSLGKTVETKFHKLRNRSKMQSKTLRSIEDYNGHSCGRESLLGPTEPSFVDAQEMFTNEVGDGIIGQDDHMGPELDSEVGQGNSFVEVDPIPIPGPPGSFLPSPRDMGSDDFQGNSSLTTSRVQSSQDQLDLVDGDSSDSPISATSTISNSMALASRSDLKYSEQLSSLGPHAVDEKMRSGFSIARIEPSVEDAATVPNEVSVGAEGINFDGENFKFNKISIEKRPPSFKNGDQPCCCQRKERISQGVTLNYEESQLLRRRTMAPVAVPAMGKQMGYHPNTRPNNLDMRPEIFPLSSCPSSGSEKVVLPVMKSSSGSIPSKGSPDAGAKFLGRSDYDFAAASPSASNPILRLMGKNLMVVNTDEDVSVLVGQTQPYAQNNHLTSQLPALSRVPPGNIQNQDCHFSHHMVPQGSVIFGQDPHNTAGQYFDARLSNSCRNHSNSKAPQTAARVPVGMFSNQHMDGAFAVSIEPCKYEGDYNFSSRQNRHKNRLCAASTYNMEKDVTSDCQQNKNADSTASIREVIVIDDVPDSESDMTVDVVKCSEGLEESQLVSSGSLIPAVANYNLKHANPFSCYQSRDPSVLGGSPVAHNTNFHVTPSRRNNTGHARWGCTSEGSGMLQRSPFMAASPSTCHLRSALYYSSSLS